MLINTLPRAHHAQDALKEVLKTMSGNVIEQAHVAIPLLGSELAATGIASDQANSKRIEERSGNHPQK